MINNFFLYLDSTTQSVFGEYLFYPETNKRNNPKKKRSKEKLPYVATGPEWREWHELKKKQQQELQQKKANIKILKEEKIRVKQELLENLKKIKPKKISVLKQLKELQLRIQKNKAEEKLLRLQLKNKQFVGTDSSLEKELKNLKENIEKDLILKQDLLQKKENFLQQEKHIKAQQNNNKDPLRHIN